MVSVCQVELDPIIPESGEWMVTVSSFMDESGKFLDSEVVVIGYVVAFDRIPNFANEWEYLLHQNGLEFLEMKEALKLYQPLSKKVSAHQPQERNEALLPFIHCIRRHLHMFGAVAIDVREYNSMPEQYRKMWSDNPCYTAFTRGILEILRNSPDDGILNFYCDDEEQTAWPFYQLYRKIKIQYTDARQRLKGISFVDDQLSFPVQASDVVSSIVRREALLRFRNDAYDFKPLFDALEEPNQPWESIHRGGVAWCDGAQLTRLGEQYKHAKEENGIVKLSDLSE